MKIPQRKPPAAMAPDLTPMIDVTFMLLIFFLVATTFRQVERRLAADLPLDEGPTTGGGPPPAEVLELKLDWQAPVMQASVRAGVGRSVVPVGAPLQLGTLAQLIWDRTETGNPHVSGITQKLTGRLEEASLHLANCDRVLVDFAGVNHRLLNTPPEASAPWGFLALAVSACVELNAARKAAGKKPLSVRFVGRSLQ